MTTKKKPTTKTKPKSKAKPARNASARSNKARTASPRTRKGGKPQESKPQESEFDAPNADARKHRLRMIDRAIDRERNKEVLTDLLKEMSATALDNPILHRINGMSVQVQARAFAAEKHVVRKGCVEYLFDMGLSHWCGLTRDELYEQGNDGIRLEIIEQVLANRGLQLLPQHIRETEKLYAAVYEEKMQLEALRLELRRAADGYRRERDSLNFAQSMLVAAQDKNIKALRRDKTLLQSQAEMLLRDAEKIYQALNIDDADITRALELINLLQANRNAEQTEAHGKPLGDLTVEQLESIIAHNTSDALHPQMRSRIEFDESDDGEFD